MKRALLSAALIIAIPLYASHIVGGEFEMIHLSGYTYQFNLILYFDDIHGNPGALDQTVTVSFFRKRDNVFITSLVLPLGTRAQVPYTQPACSSGFLQTDRLFYTSNITLSPDIFNDSEGYYASWQRCCRNYNITNIYSEDPNIGDPITAGQTFYMEFPPVVKNGEPFVNSSPHLFPPLSDYGCPGRPYYVNFAGVDDDGDSIVYSLTTPLNTKSGTALPEPSPAPYPLVTWRPGYSLLNIMNGSPDLRISTDGLLTCTPTTEGLFVFAIKAEEYRDGIKIGETRRDFQMLVVNGCQPDQPPQIVGKKLTDTGFTYVKTMPVIFSDTTSNGTRCIVVRVSDPDSQDSLQNYSENVSIRVVPLNFKNKNIDTVLPTVTKAHLANGSTAEFTICFPQCPFTNGPFQIGIIAADDACSLPMTDTLKITVTVPYPPNSNAYFLPQKNIEAQLYEGGSGTWPITAKDDDGDNLVISVLPDHFVLKDAGMTFNYNAQPGSVNGALHWDAFCKNYEFSKQTDFSIKVLVDDDDVCRLVHFDTATFQLKVILPDIEPKLKIYNETKTKELTDSLVEMNLGHIAFDVAGTDINTSAIDTLNLSLLNVEGNVEATGYVFSPATGLHDVESVLVWDPTCSIFIDGTYDNLYTFKFLVQNNHCKTPKTDTAYVKLRIKDIESTGKNFLPANVITTYPDHCNDFFAIEGYESEPDCNGQARSIPLPPLDNCINRFERVKIYDRWGKQVFESTDRKFRWYAQNETAGVYFYVLYFTKTQYKSSLTVIH
ncbi:MAG: gliding motility-associated C-terminal domain-containing protein [Bacteroidetes bacterium]|nr:gliding motility-associated C-terminal domain-containing protein [Bacteroidota bacterium]